MEKEVESISGSEMQFMTAYEMSRKVTLKSRLRGLPVDSSHLATAFHPQTTMCVHPFPRVSLQKNPSVASKKKIQVKTKKRDIIRTSTSHIWYAFVRLGRGRAVVMRRFSS